MGRCRKWGCGPKGGLQQLRKELREEIVQEMYRTVDKVIKGSDGTVVGGAAARNEGVCPYTVSLKPRCTYASVETTIQPRPL